MLPNHSLNRPGTAGRYLAQNEMAGQISLLCPGPVSSNVSRHSPRSALCLLTCNPIRHRPLTLRAFLGWMTIRQYRTAGAASRTYLPRRHFKLSLASTNPLPRRSSRAKHGANRPAKPSSEKWSRQRSPSSPETTTSAPVKARIKPRLQSNPTPYWNLPARTRSSKQAAPSCSFQPKQLAREFVLTLQRAGDKHPILLLLLPEAPPVPVRGQGRRSISEAISLHLADVLGDTDAPSTSAAAAHDQIDRSRAGSRGKMYFPL